MTPRTALLAAVLCAAGAAAVFAAIGQPASAEASRLAQEVSSLQTETAQMRARIRKLQQEKVQALPPVTEARQQVASVATLLPAQTGYSVRAEAPGQFVPPGGQPIASQVRMNVSVEHSYEGAVGIVKALAGLPTGAVEELSLERLPAKPGTVKLTATVVLLFEGGPPGPQTPPPTGGQQ